MYCPECGTEYRDGFTECSDCRVPLIAGTPPPQPQGSFDPNLELVVVLETDDPMIVAWAKDTLEEAGIPFLVLGEEISARMQPLDAMIHKWCRLQVARDREAEARALLQPLEEVVRNPVADEKDQEDGSTT